MSSNVPVLNPSLAAAVDTGDVSRQTANLLQSGRDPSEADLGVNPEEIRTPKVTLVAVLLDDSGSMDSQRQAVIDAINDLLIAPLRQQQSRNDILLAITSMFHGVLLPFTRIQSLEKFNSRRYVTDGGDTPLYESTRDTLRLLVEKQGELALSSIGARILFLVYTDAGENRNNVPLSEIKAMVADLDSKKANALYGIGCGTTATNSLLQMGFKTGRVSNVNDPIALAEAFNQFSRATSAAAAGSTGDAAEE